MGKWEMVRLGDVCEIVSGTTPSTNKPELWDGEIKWITPAEISDESYYISDTERHISQKAGLKIMPVGTVLLSSRAPIGKVAIAGAEMCCNQGFKNLICSVAVHNRYLYRYLKNQTEYLNSLGRGATFKEISKTVVEQIELPLPPLPVQQQIADVLDRASSLIEKRKAQIEKLDLLVKSQFIEMFGDPVTNPKGWVRRALEQTYEIIDGDRGENYPKRDEFYSDEYCLFLNTGNVTKNGFDFTRVEFITKSKDIKLRKGKLQRHDIVLTTRGTVGNLAYYDNQIGYEHVRINSGMVILRTRGSVNPHFFIEQFKISQIYTGLISGTAQPQLPIGNLKKAKVLFPPLSLQNKFAEFVQQVESQKLLLQQSLAKMEQNYKSLMQKCFRGEIF